MVDPTHAASIIDRRSLRRKLLFWRIAAVIAVAGLAFALAGLPAGNEADGDHVARIAIEGMIAEDKDLAERIEAAGKNDAVKAIILVIDSPGGTTVGGEMLHEAVKAAAAQKPVVASVGTLAASAAYMVASATGQIVARESSLVGSIGVIIQGPNFARALDKLGVDVETYKSAPLKAEPSPFNATTDEERAAIDSVIRDSYDWFVTLVSENRKMSRADTLKVATGAIFTGRQAKANGLVDALGGEAVAVDWLAEKGIDRELPVIDHEAPLDLTASLLGAVDKRTPLARQLLGELGLDPLFLDGMISVWQGPGSADGGAIRNSRPAEATP